MSLSSSTSQLLGSGINLSNRNQPCYFSPSLKIHLWSLMVELFNPISPSSHFARGPICQTRRSFVPIRVWMKWPSKRPKPSISCSMRWWQMDSSNGVLNLAPTPSVGGSFVGPFSKVCERKSKLRRSGFWWMYFVRPPYVLTLTDWLGYYDLTNVIYDKVGVHQQF